MTLAGVSANDGGVIPDTGALLKWLMVVLVKIKSLLALPVEVLANIRRWWNARCMALSFPCNKPWPVIGHVLDLGLHASVSDLLDYFVSECMRWRAGRAQLGPFTHIFIVDPRDIQLVVSNSKNQSKTKLYRLTEEAIGQGLVAISGPKWRRHHKIIAPAFYVGVLDSFVPVFNNHADILLEHLQKHADGRAFDVSPLIEHVAFNIICETAMGISDNSEKQNSRLYQQSLGVVQSELVERFQRPWLYPQFLYRLTAGGKRAEEAHKILREAQSEAIRARRFRMESPLTHDEDASSENLSGRRRQRQAFIDLLLEQQKSGAAHITDQEIAEEIDTLMFTGFDTVKLSVGFALYALSNAPECQKKILDELESVFDEKQPIQITPESLRQLTYLECVVKETLRMFPPVWFFARKTGVDVPLASCDLVIPQGYDVIVCIKGVHMDPSLYPNPEIFDPDRFSPNNTANRHPYGYIPFGCGQRICIGRRYGMLEAKTLLAKILWYYEIHPDPSFKPIYTWGITSSTTNGLWIKLRERCR